MERGGHNLIIYYGFVGEFMHFNFNNFRKLRIFKVSPSNLLKKINRKIHDMSVELIDLKRFSYNDYKLKVMYSYIDYKMLNTSEIDKNVVLYLFQMYRNHFFDLLGSGFIKVDYNIFPMGIEEFKYDMSPKITEFDYEGDWLKRILLPHHADHAKIVWKNINKEYTPIDWQMDFKSGYRYSQKKWYKRQPIGKFIGADIKIPWEISRMQHLPQLSIFSLVLPDIRNEVLDEFKNEIYDFAATNPIRMGANWTCTMDVAIRASNMLIAYDILQGIDEHNILNEEFGQFFGNFIFEHGKFIVNNLEWYDGNNGNHYLADICGLLFVSSYLERNDLTDSWLAFAIQELINCMEKQFYDDGGNFEASTSYHRLSGEFMIYSTALIYGLLKNDKKEALKSFNVKNVKRLCNNNKQRYNIEDIGFFPNWYLNKLFKSGCFTMDILKSNENVPQIGDNDNGRFFKFTPIGDFLSYNELISKYRNLNKYKKLMGIEKYFDENVLDHSAFISSLNGIFDFNGFEYYSTKYPLEKSIIECIAKNYKIKEHDFNKDIKISGNNYPNLKFKKTTEIIYSDFVYENIIIDEIKLKTYPDFGLYVFKSNNFYLSIFAGVNGQNGKGGHSHNDKLSFELNLCGNDIFVDPGTYLYTPFPEKRDYFRSVNVHNVPIPIGREQNELIDMFKLSNDTKCQIIECSQNKIRILLAFKDVKIVREFIVFKNKLVINDSCSNDFDLCFNRGEVYSNGYGKLSSITSFTI